MKENDKNDQERKRQKWPRKKTLSCPYIYGTTFTTKTYPEKETRDTKTFQKVTLDNIYNTYIHISLWKQAPISQLILHMMIWKNMSLEDELSGI